MHTAPIPPTQIQSPRVTNNRGNSILHILVGPHALLD